MTELDEELRRWADQAVPVRGQEARSRAREVANGSPSDASRRYSVWLVAAALLVVVGITTAIVSSGDHHRDRVRTTDHPVGSSTPTSPERGPSSGEQASAVPGWFVAHDARHRLVVVDSATFQTIRVLDSFDDPTTPAPPGEPGGMGRYLGPMAVSPDGKTVYFEVCCEPAVGEIYRIPIEGGRPERVAYGTSPAVSPDGTRLAVVEMQDLRVINLATGDSTLIPIGSLVQPPAGGQVMGLSQPAWSPDGSTLAYVLHVQLDQARVVVRSMTGDLALSGSERSIVEADADGTPMFPTFDAAGRLHVVRQRYRDSLQTAGPARLEVWDPSGRGETSHRDLDQGVLAHLQAVGGGPLLLVLADGSLTITTADETRVAKDGGWVDAAW